MAWFNATAMASNTRDPELNGSAHIFTSTELGVSQTVEGQLVTIFKVAENIELCFQLDEVTALSLGNKLTRWAEARIGADPETKH